MKKENTSKFIKTGLVALAVTPALTNLLETSANELDFRTTNIPGVGDRPEENEPVNPDPQPPVTPEPPEQQPPTTPEPPEQQPPVTPEPPQQPVVEFKYVFEGTSNDAVIVKQSEVGNILSLANVKIQKTTTTLTDGAPTETVTEEATPILVGSVDNSLGVKTVTFTADDPVCTDQWTFTVNVVNENALIDSTRSLMFNINKSDVTLTQSQSQAIADPNEFITLCEVSAFDANGNELTVTLPTQEGAANVRAGIVGTHRVEFGVEKTALKARTIVSQNPFIVAASVTVTDEGLVENTPTQDGLVDRNQLLGYDSAKMKSSTSTSTVSTGTTNNLFVILTSLVVAALSLTFIKKRNK